jgi:hypothetical protein
MSGRHSLDPWHLKYLLGKRSDDWYASLFLKAQQKGLRQSSGTNARTLFCSALRYTQLGTLACR